jgi:hypothetical protein
MVYRRRSTPSGSRGGFFHLENEKTKARVFGYGHGQHIRLRDEYGNVWSGCAEEKDDEIYYRFRDRSGRSLTGVSKSAVLVLRDDRGEIWRGFVD